MSSVYPPAPKCDPGGAVGTPCDYAPLSLNHLIREGISSYPNDPIPKACFELELAKNLNRVVGSSAQLRRLFEVLVDCLVESAQLSVPTIRFQTHNINALGGNGFSMTARRRLPSGTYAVMQIVVDDICIIPTFQPFGVVAQNKQLNLFAWTQIYEVVQIHRGLLFGTHSDGVTTDIEIILPAIRLPHKTTIQPS